MSDEAMETKGVPVRGFDLSWEEMHLIYQAAARRVEGRYMHDYSGRAMYGALCPAIVCDADDATMIGLAVSTAAHGLGWHDPKLIDKLVPRRKDDMGLDIVMYAPSIVLTNDVPRPERRAGEDYDDE